MFDIRGSSLFFLCLFAFASCGGSGGGSAAVVVAPPQPQNAAPVASGGGNQTLQLPAVLSLSGSATDDGLGGPLEFAWSVLSAPGDVHIVDPTAADTLVTFSEPGEYALRLSVTDTDLEDFDDVRVTVEALPGNEIVLDDTQTFQTLSGWEATAIAGQLNPAFGLFDEQLFDNAVADGVNRIRLEVRAGAENDTDWFTLWQDGVVPYATWRENRYATVNDNGSAADLDLSGFIFSELDNTVERVVVPLRQKLQAAGQELYVNLCYVAITGQIADGLEYAHDDPDEYAEFVLATVTHLSNEWGIVPDSIEVVLEPDNQAEWNGTLIGQALAATGPLLEGAGFTPRFVAPSCSNMALAITYFDELAVVPGALGYMSELSYHRYGGVSTANLEAIRMRAETWGLDTAHLEYISAGHAHLHQDLKVANNSAWQQYAMLSNVSVGDSGAGYYLVDDTDAANPFVSVGWRTEFLRLYFRYLPAGSVRIESTSTNPNLDPVSFIRPDGGHVTVVMAQSGGTFYVQGLPEGSYGVKYTTHDESNVDGGDLDLIPGQILTGSIPGEGVITVFSH